VWVTVAWNVFQALGSGLLGSGVRSECRRRLSGEIRRFDMRDEEVYVGGYLNVLQSSWWNV